jgi:hypothetical protein
MPITYGGESSGWRPGKNPTISVKVKRKNGTFQGFSAKSNSKANTKPHATKPKDTAKYTWKVKRDNGVFRGWTRVKKDGVQAAAKRRAEGGGNRDAQIAKKYKERLSSSNPNNPNKYTKGMNYIRKERASRGEFKGHYYGPDQFKGNIELVDKWRKAGGKKSDIKKTIQWHKNRSS